MELCIDRLTKQYGHKLAVDRVDLELHQGVYGLLGANGAGKTTLMRMLCDILTPTSGEIRYNGREIGALGEDYRSCLGYLPQNFGYYPEFTAEKFLLYLAALKGLGKIQAGQKMLELLDLVGLAEERKHKIRTFSGGMKQRVVIAIALACNPELLIADEPTTALDVTIQAQVLELMRDLKAKMGTSTILITHDLGVVAEMCDSVAIMYAGMIMEYGSLREIYKETRHPYTLGLFGSIPDLHNDVPRLKPIPGMVPDPTEPIVGCPFANRCDRATELCRSQKPDLYSVGGTHRVRCHHIERCES